MSLALAHFLLGATIALWLMTYEPDHHDNDGVWWVLIGGIWGMGPDLAKFWPVLEPFHDNLIASSLFGLHGLLDVADPTDSIYVAALMVAVFGITVILTRHHDIR